MQENIFDAIEEIRALNGGLKSLQHLLQIAEKSYDDINLEEFGDLLGTIAYCGNCRLDQILKLLNTEK